MKEITELRIEIVHRRPYGSVCAERFGWAIPVRAELGLYRYVRPVQIEGQPELDLLDLICSRYSACTGLFFEAAKASGLDGNMVTLADKDVVSLKVTRGSLTDQQTFLAFGMPTFVQLQRKPGMSQQGPRGSRIAPSNRSAPRDPIHDMLTTKIQ